METIFDHDPTEEEMERFKGLKNMELREIYLKGDTDNHFYDLGILFSIRNDEEKSNYYFSKIKDKTILNTLMQDF